MLNTDTVTPYLLTQRLLNTEAIIDGALTIVSAARRNRNLRVEGPAGVGYLIKQPDDSGQDSDSTLHCEAAFYSFCQQQAETITISRLLPRFVHFDAEQSVLVLELLRSATPLWQYYWTHGADHLTDIARGFGHALGAVHKIFRASASAWAGDTHLPWLYRNPPWVMQLHKPAPEILARLSPGNYHTLRILQTQDGISNQLDGLRKIVAA